MKKKKKNCYVSHADSVVLYPVLFKIQECPVPPVFRNLNLSLHLFIDRLKKDFYILLCFNTDKKTIAVFRTAAKKVFY